MHPVRLVRLSVIVSLALRVIEFATVPVCAHGRERELYCELGAQSKEQCGANCGCNCCGCWLDVVLFILDVVGAVAMLIGARTRRGRKIRLGSSFLDRLVAVGGVCRGLVCIVVVIVVVCLR